MSTSTTASMRETALPDLESPSRTRARAVMDEEAFRAFYERTARPLWAYLARITGDRQLADDLLQEAYYRFFRAAAAHADETHRRNSLFRIATNLATDVRRHERRVPHTSLPDEDAGGIPDAAGATATATSRAGDRTDLARAMARLRPDQREMVWLAYVHGSSHAEIAEVLGVKAASVKLLLFRARKKLARFLRGEA